MCPSPALVSGPVSLGMAGGGTRNGVSESHRVYDAACCRQSAPGRRDKPSSRTPQQQTRGQYRNHGTIVAETRAVEWWPGVRVELSVSCAVSLLSARPLGWWWRVAASSAQPHQVTQAGDWPSTCSDNTDTNQRVTVSSELDNPTGIQSASGFYREIFHCDNFWILILPPTHPILLSRCYEAMGTTNLDSITTSA